MNKKILVVLIAGCFCSFLSFTGCSAYSVGVRKQREINTLEENSQKVKENYQKETSNLVAQHYQHNLLPPDYVISEGSNLDLIAEVTAEASMPIFYSIGNAIVKSGVVVILGKEKMEDGNDYYVGFTTACAVTLDHPYRYPLSEDAKYNELVMIKPPKSVSECYLIGDGGYGYPYKGTENSALFNILPRPYRYFDYAKKKSDDKELKIKLKKFGRNDVALVYFPAESYYFGYKKTVGPEKDKDYYLKRGIGEDVPTLGIEHPTDTVGKIIKNSTELFNQDFVLHCEECDKKIIEVPAEMEQIKLEYSKIVQEVIEKHNREIGEAQRMAVALANKEGEKGVEKGRGEKCIIELAGLVHPLAQILASFVVSALPEGIPARTKKSISKKIGQFEMKSVNIPAWTKYVKPGLSMWVEEFKPYRPDTTPMTLGEVIPHEIESGQIQDVSSNNLLLKNGSVLELGGISVKQEDKNKFEDLLKGFIANAKQLIVVPYKREGNKLLINLLADDNYLNQLLVMEGLAEPNKKDNDFPFKDFFVDKIKELMKKSQ